MAQCIKMEQESGKAIHTNGILEFPATQFGVGEYSIYASCSNSSESVDTPWANFSVVAGADIQMFLSARTL